MIKNFGTMDQIFINSMRFDKVLLGYSYGKASMINFLYRQYMTMGIDGSKGLIQYDYGAIEKQLFLRG